MKTLAITSVDAQRDFVGLRTGVSGPRTRKKLTFDLDPETHRRFKAWCACNETTMVSWLVEKIGETLDAKTETDNVCRTDG